MHGFIQLLGQCPFEGTGLYLFKDTILFEEIIKTLPACEIGAKLKLTPNTMSTYRARIMEKSGTKNDMALAQYAQQHGRSPTLR